MENDTSSSEIQESRGKHWNGYHIFLRKSYTNLLDLWERNLIFQKGIYEIAREYGSMVKQLMERRIKDKSTVSWLDGWPTGTFKERESERDRNVCLCACVMCAFVYVHHEVLSCGGCTLLPPTLISHIYHPHLISPHSLLLNTTVFPTNYSSQSTNTWPLKGRGGVSTPVSPWLNRAGPGRLGDSRYTWIT